LENVGKYLPNLDHITVLLKCLSIIAVTIWLSDKIVNLFWFCWSNDDLSTVHIKPSFSGQIGFSSLIFCGLVSDICDLWTGCKTVRYH